MRLLRIGWAAADKLPSPAILPAWKEVSAARAEGVPPPVRLSLFAPHPGDFGDARRKQRILGKDVAFVGDVDKRTPQVLVAPGNGNVIGRLDKTDMGNAPGKPGRLYHALTT